MAGSVTGPVIFLKHVSNMPDCVKKAGIIRRRCAQDSLLSGLFGMKDLRG